MPHWPLSGSFGVRDMISEIGSRLPCRTPMKMRGMSGKWKAMWHSSPPTEGSPKYSTTSSGQPLASASSTRSG
ncbi:hypothetical protein GCM10018952_36690 [Streptosporangium vulgare]